MLHADMENKSTMGLCLVGHTDCKSASNHKVRVLVKFVPCVQFQNGVCGRVELKVLEELKKPILSTSRMCKAGYDVNHTESHSGLLTKGLVWNTGSTSANFRSISLFKT